MPATSFSMNTRRAALTTVDRARIERRFRQAVNMTASQIEAWLATKESKAVGSFRPGARSSVGRQSGKKIVRLLRQGPRTAADFAHMRKVVGYVARHRAQRPAGPVHTSRWRYSLMNWGHDPL